MHDVYGTSIIVRGSDGFLFQRKTAGYFMERFVGQLCLIGGGWTEASDLSPRDTAWRELVEELRPLSLIEGLDATSLRFIQGFDVSLPERVTGSQAVRMINFLFDLTLDRPLGDQAFLTEGEAAFAPDSASVTGPFCWGYDHILAFYAQHRGVGFSALEVASEVRCEPLMSEEPDGYAALDLSGLRLNPFEAPVDESEL